MALMESEEIKKIYEQLSAPFLPSEISWRVQQSGNKDGKMWAMVMPYITARAVMTRLDNVVGVFNWKDTYRPYKENGVLCQLCVRIGDEWICKQDAAEDTRIEKYKGGVSDALKRAAVKFGIGRYLYELDTVFVEVMSRKPSGVKSYYVNDKKNNVFGYYVPPALPDWAVSDIGRVVKAFEVFNVSARQIEKYLEHPLNKTTIDEITDLRNIYQSIASNDATPKDIFGKSKKRIKTTATMKSVLDGVEVKK